MTEVVTLAIERVCEESLPPALVLAAQLSRIEHLIVSIWTLEQGQLCLVRAVSIVSVILRVHNELSLFASAVHRLASGHHQKPSLAVPRATIVSKVGRALILDDGSWIGCCHWTEIVQGAVVGIWEVSFGSAGKGRGTAAGVVCGRISASVHCTDWIAVLVTGGTLSYCLGSSRPHIAHLGRGGRGLVGDGVLYH